MCIASISLIIITRTKTKHNIYAVAIFLLVSINVNVYFAYISALKLEGERSSRTSVNFYRTVLQNVWEDGINYHAVVHSTKLTSKSYALNVTKLMSLPPHKLVHLPLCYCESWEINNILEDGK